MTPRTGTLTSLTHNALRIVAGLLFWQHGAQKLFGWLGGQPVDQLMTLRGWAGIFEFFGGILIVLGLLTVPVALLLVLEMGYAYLTVHAPRALWPIENGGELALLYLFIFLFLAAAGPGSLSLDAWWRGRRAAGPGAEREGVPEGARSSSPAGS